MFGDRITFLLDPRPLGLTGAAGGGDLATRGLQLCSSLSPTIQSLPSLHGNQGPAVEGYGGVFGVHMAFVLNRKPLGFHFF